MGMGDIDRDVRKYSFIQVSNHKPYTVHDESTYEQSADQSNPKHQTRLFYLVVFF